ncbi:hypothetical protein DVH24_010084 [Malus domestica]|uniref:C-JID domain-containing protein n=1 Tax=Malus domestica TaxID=3750 RepID=A0A498JP97_MALDO|nr:hypothetical protein DVH24_010084 [Malus domestica]
MELIEFIQVFNIIVIAIGTLFYMCCRSLTFSSSYSSSGVLNLGYSGILEIPDGLFCSNSLRYIDLSGTKIKSIPSSIKEASKLSRLCLVECKKLQSLPELPAVSHLEADGCTSLKTVSSSKTALTEAWDIYELFQVQLNFSNCGQLDHNARSNIMSNAQLRIMRVATASSKFRSEQKDQEMSSYQPLATVVCPGSEIPNWFPHQNDGTSTKVKLPTNWFREGFLGFALSVVVAFDNWPVQQGLKFGCKYNFKADEGESHEISCHFFVACRNGRIKRFLLDSDHMFVFYQGPEFKEGAKWSSAFFKRVTEVSVYFFPPSDRPDPVSGEPFVKVEKCGIHLLYSEEAEKLKFDVISRELQVEEEDEAEASGIDEPEATESDESGASGGAEFEAASESDECVADESEASGSDEAEESGSDQPFRFAGMTLTQKRGKYEEALSLKPVEVMSLKPV